MPVDNKNSKLKHLQDSLYNINKGEGQSSRRVIHDIDFNVPPSWDRESDEAQAESSTNSELPQGKSKAPIILLILSLLVFIGAAVFAGYRLTSGSGDVSKNLIALESKAPPFIDGGEQFDYLVSISNQNKSKLELVELEVSYVQGLEEGESSKFVTKKTIGDMLPETLIRETIPLTLYGVPGTIKTVTTTLRYSVPGSTAIFEKTETNNIEIKSSSLNVSLETLKEVTPGQTVTIKVKVEATRGKTIPDQTLKMIYPTGFEFVSADILPSKGNNLWDLGSLAAGTVHEINIVGIPRGEDTQVRNIRAQVGLKDQSGLTIGALFAESSFEYILTKPFLQTDILIADRKQPTHTLSSGNEITVTIDYKNTINKSLQNSEISLLMEGEAILEDTIKASGGFYDSKTNTVTWTKSGVADLGLIELGEGGRVTVVFKTKSSSSLDVNPEINLTVSSKARRIGESQISEAVVASQSTTIKLITQIALIAETARKSVFEVFGPVPPKKEEETSYVLVTTIKNTVNPVEKAEVTFKLPQNVRFIESRASQGTVSYSNFDREVTWKAGNLLRSGSQVDPVAYIHVVVTPSITEVGTSLALGRNFMLTGIDTFTKKSLTANGPTSLTTIFRQADGYKRGDEIVNK